MNTNAKKISNIITLVQTLLALSGLGVCIYLLIQHYNLQSGIQTGSSFCSVGKMANCDIVNISPYSQWFGIPIAALGGLFFFTVFILAVRSKFDAEFSERFQAQILGLSLLALLCDSYLFYVQAFILKTFCLVCLFTYVIEAALFWMARRHWPELGFKAALQNAFSAKHWLKLAPCCKTHTSLFAALALTGLMGVMALIPSAIRIQSPLYQYVDKAIEQFYDKWKEQPSINLSITPSDAVWGNKDAKIIITEFSDFECPFCKQAAFTLHNVLQSYAKDVLFVFKNFPLDMACNSTVERPMHAQACKLARLSYCAGKKSRFWEFHDALFLELTKEQIQDGLEFVLEHLALKNILSRAESNECLQSSESEEAVRGQIEQGIKIGIKGTPAIFINGRALTVPLTPEVLSKILALEKN